MGKFFRDSELGRRPRNTVSTVHPPKFKPRSKWKHVEKLEKHRHKGMEARRPKPKVTLPTLDFMKDEL